MKKAQTITAFILLAVIIWMRFYAPINKVALILKHISLFLLIGIGAYAVTTAILKKLVSKYKPTGTKESLVYIGRVLSFGVIIILFGSLQYNFIKFTETPYVEGCQFYDKYDNLIYQSKFYTSCPDLDIITSNEEVLEFNVQEHTDIKEAAILGVSETALSRNDLLDLTVFSTIKIEYFDNSQIKSISYRVTFNGEVTGEGNSSTYYSYHKKIENSFDSGYSSIVQEAEIKTTYDYTKDLTLDHYDFEDSDYTSTTFYVDENYNRFEEFSGGPSIKTVSYSLYKDYFDDENNLTTEKIANVFFIKEDDKITYVQLPTDLSYPNELWQSVDERRIDIEFDNNLITWIVKTKNGATDFLTKRVYSDENQNLLNQTSFEFETENNTELQFDRLIEYRTLLQDSKTYLYSQNVSGPVQFPGDYSNGLESIESTEYGTKVEKLKYRSQNYINYLIYGDISYASLYYEMGDYADGFSFYKMFSIEYDLIELQQSDSIFYKEPIYFIYN